MKQDNGTEGLMVDESHINGVFVWKVAFIAAMGGLLFGYDFMVISGTTIYYWEHFHIADNGWLQGLSVISAPIGCIIGAAFSMIFSDTFGRKKLLIWAAILFLISAIGTAAAWSFVWFNIMRLIGGMGIGLAANLSPMYIAEISPAGYRGKVVTVNQFTIMIGIVVSQIVNLFIQRYGDEVGVTAAGIPWNEAMGWRMMFGAEAIPALGFLGLIFTVPRSPRWLVKRGLNDEAQNVLAMVGGEQYARAEVADIASTISREEVATINVGDLLEPRLLKIIVLGMFLTLVQQWSGLNSVFAYSHQIFHDAGFTASDTMISLVFEGATMLIFCVVAMFIVDRVGRKILMVGGALAISVTHLMIGLSFHFHFSGIFVVVLVMLAIALYAMTLAPVMWVLLSEIFPNRIRGVALGISVVTLWVAYSILTLTFPKMREIFGTAETFWVYSGFLFIAFLVMLVKLPETKGKSLEQIERELVD